MNALRGSDGLKQRTVFSFANKERVVIECLRDLDSEAFVMSIELLGNFCSRRLTHVLRLVTYPSYCHICSCFEVPARLPLH